MEPPWDAPACSLPRCATQHRTSAIQSHQCHSASHQCHSASHQCHSACAPVPFSMRAKCPTQPGEGARAPRPRRRAPHAPTRRPPRGLFRAVQCTKDRPLGTPLWAICSLADRHWAHPWGDGRAHTRREHALGRRSRPLWAHPWGEGRAHTRRPHEASHRSCRRAPPWVPRCTDKCTDASPCVATVLRCAAMGLRCPDQRGWPQVGHRSGAAFTRAHQRIIDLRRSGIALFWGRKCTERIIDRSGAVSTRAPG